LVREKVQKTPEFREVIYDEAHWRLLQRLRREALIIIEALAVTGLNPVVHGSVARGDVWEGSDIDVFIPYPIPSYKLEYVLELSGLQVRKKYIVMATPVNTPKAYVVLDDEERRTVSFPLANLKPREHEFYRFGGLLDRDGLISERRAPGVNKKLVLIEPVENGHLESPVIGFESVVAEKLGVSVETVLERVRVLSRRDSVGRTGVFLKHVLQPDETFEDAIQELARRNSIVRRALQR
jgi:predicted nucleotidyltransferase